MIKRLGSNKKTTVNVEFEYIYSSSALFHLGQDHTQCIGNSLSNGQALDQKNG